MPAGGTLTVRVTQDPAAVRLDVIDSGPGIPPEDLEKIFDLYYTTKKSGLGLGLPIAQKILSEHRGIVNVRSRPGETCFSIGLPLTPPAQDPHENASLPAARR
jgi:signal transduction histidine kinase